MQTSGSAIGLFTCFGMLLGCVLGVFFFFFFRAAEPQHVIFANEMLDSEIYNIIVSEGGLLKKKKGSIIKYWLQKW